MELVLEQLPIVVKSLNIGFLQTLKLFFVTLIGAMPLGLLISFASMSRFKPLSYLTKIIVWIVRGTPLMIQLLIIFYFPGLILGVPIWGGGESGRFMAAAVAFIFNYACYFSEIYRGGIQSVPIGQEEAGLVLGMKKGQIFFRVKLLQMVKRIIPPMSNEIITLVKDTSLARIIALQEIQTKLFVIVFSKIKSLLLPISSVNSLSAVFTVFFILSIIFSRLTNNRIYEHLL